VQIGAIAAQVLGAVERLVCGRVEVGDRPDRVAPGRDPDACPYLEADLPDGDGVSGSGSTSSRSSRPHSSASGPGQSRGRSCAACPIRFSARLLARLIEEVTVKETSFLRDREQLASIDWKLRLERALARGADRVGVWTAPCATEEL
jgi:hypothetical protein